MKIEIANGRLVDPKHGVDRPASLYIAAGRVVAIGAPPAGWQAGRVIDATGCVVAPGLVDLAARLREPGLEHKATLESEMDAAVAGGVTSLACPPDTDPPLDEPGLVEMLKQRARLSNHAHVHPVGALTVGLAGETLTEMGELTEAGCVAFSQADRPLVDTQVLLPRAAVRGDVRLRGVAAAAGSAPLPRRRRARRRGRDAAGPAGDSRHRRDGRAGDHLRAGPRDGAGSTCARLSTAEGVAMVRAAKAEGLAVTCDVAVHHLHLCDVDLGWFDPQCRLDPPLRGTRDRAALRAGLADGTIDASARTTRRSTTTPSRCRSARPSRARRAWNSCCR